MNKPTPKSRVRFRCSRLATIVALFGVFVLVATSVFLYAYTRGAAAVSANNTVNFQARLETNTGAIAPDGNYNVQFKLYDASTGGNNLWTETRTGANQVRVQNGYLTVNLGSVTAFPSSINWAQQLYLTMNIGGTGSTPSYDGEMSPRLLLTATPYAFAASTLANVNSVTGYKSSISFQGATNGDQSFTIPDLGTAGSATVCLSTGNCTGTGGSLAGSGLQNFVAKFDTSSGNHLGNSSIFDNGAFVGINNSTTNNGLLSIQGATTTQSSLFVQGTGSASASTIVVQQGSSQTGNLISFQDSAGNVNGSINATGNILTLGNATNNSAASIGQITLADGTGNGFTDTLQVGTAGHPLTASGVISIPNSGGNDQVCLQTLANCTGTGGGIAGSGTQNYIAKFDTVGGNHIASSSLYDNGSFLGLNTTTNSGLFSIQGASASQSSIFVQGKASASAATIVVKAASSQTGDLFQNQDNNGNVLGGFNASGNLYYANSGYTTTFNTATLTGNQTVSLPNASGTVALTSNTTNFIRNQTSLQAGNFNIAAPSGVAATITGASDGSDIADFNTAGGALAARITSNGNLNVRGNIYTSFQTTNATGGIVSEIQNINTTATATATNNFSAHLLGTANSNTNANTLNGYQLQNVTAVTNNVFNGIEAGTGYNSILDYNNGTTIINGTGILQSVALSGTYSNALTITNTANVFGGTSATLSGNVQGGTITSTGVASVNGLTNTGGTLLAAKSISDVSSGGNIGTAPLTVDAYTTFNVNQVTAGQTLTLPNPTNTTAGRLIYVSNVGTASFTIYGITAAPGTTQDFIWNGTAWTVNGSGTTGNYIQNGTAQQTGNFNVAAASGVAATIQGANTQDIIDFKNSAGSNVASINASGNFTANSGTFNSNVSVTGTVIATNNITSQTGDVVAGNSNAQRAILGRNGGNIGVYLGNGTTYDTNITRSSAGNLTSNASLALQGGALSLGVASSTSGVLTLYNASHANAVTIQSSATLANALTLTIPADTNTTDTVCLQTLANCGAASGGNGYIQNQYATAQSANFFIQGAANTTSAVIEAASGANTALSILNSSGSTAAYFNGGGSLVIGATQAAAARLTINSSGVTTVGTVYRGMASQTGDASQIQDVNGNILSGTTANGSTYGYGTTTQLIGLATPTGVASSVSGTTNYYKVSAVNAQGETAASTEVSGGAATTISWTAVNGATSYRVYRGTSAGGEAGYYTVTAPTVSLANADTVTLTGSNAPLTNSSNTSANLLIQGWGGQITATQVLQAGAGQTGDIFDAKNSSGVNVLSINSAGTLYAYGNVVVGGSTFSSSTGGTAREVLAAPNATGSLLIGRANASQTANLIELQSSTGSLLSGFNASGNLYYGNNGFTGTVQSATLSANQTYTLPNASGTIALANDTTNFIRNQTSQQAGANFNIAASSGVAATIQGVSGSDIADFLTSNGTKTTYINTNGTFYAPNATFGAGVNQGANGYALGINGQTNSATGTNMVSGTNVALNGIATSGTNTLNGFNFQSVTAKTNNTFNGLNFADTSYNNVLSVAGTSIINGSGVLQSAGLTGTYSNALTLNNAANVFGGTSATLSGNVQGGTLTSTGLTTTAGLTNTGATILSAITIANLASGGSVGTAATTVDVASTLNVNQTTTGQTLTLPNPTVTTAGHLLYVSNIGTASFTIYGITAAPGTTQDFIWNGSAWTVNGSGTTGNYIQNGTSQQTANFNIQGTAGTVSAIIQASDASHDIVDFKGNTGNTVASINYFGQLVSNSANILSTNGAGTPNINALSTNTNTTSTTVTRDNLQLNTTGSANTSGQNINNAIHLSNVTAATGNTFNGIEAGTGYNSILDYNNGTTLINGTGILQSVALSGTYSNALTLNNTSNVFGGTSATLSGAVQGGSFANTNNTFAVTATGVTKLALDTTTGATAVCQNASGNLSACSSTYETTTGTDFIQNQSASTQTGNYKISGTGTAANFYATTNLGVNNTNAANPFAVNTLTTAQSGYQAAISTNGTTNNGLVIQGVAGQTNATTLFAVQGSTGSNIIGVNGTGSVGVSTSFGLNNSTSLTGNNFYKNYIAGTGGVTVNDVVVFANDGGNGRVIDSTTAYDTRIAGVASNTAAAGAGVAVSIAGTYTVTYTGTAPVIGDQLVVSSVSGAVKVDNNATAGILGYATTAGSGGTVGVRLQITSGANNPTFNGNVTVGGTVSVSGQTVFNNSGVLQSVALSGTYSNALTLNNAANVFGGTSATLSGNVQGGTISNTNSSFAVTATGVTKLALDTTTGATAVCQNASGNLSACSSTYETTTGTDFIRNSTTQQTSSNFNISGTGVAAILQAGTFDANAAGTLTIGGTNATSISLTQNVSVAAGKGITFAAGAGNFDQSASTGTFQSGTGTFSINGNELIAGGKNLTFNSGAGYFDQSASTGTFDTGTGTVRLNGNTTVASGKNLSVTSGTVSVGGQTVFNNTGILQSAALSGTYSNALTLNNTANVFGGSSATLSGNVQGGTITSTGLTTTAGLTNTGATLLSALSISNLSSGGNIGVASATVDVATTFNVNQTTAGQTLTLPSPTNTTAGRLAYVSNVGTASFTLYGITATPGTTQDFIWNGTAWTVNGSGTNGNYIQNGTTLQAGNFYIQSSASSTTPTATIQVASGQSGNVLQINNASGNGIAAISSSGNLFTATTIDTYNTANSLSVGTSNATAVNIGRSSTTTTINGTAAVSGNLTTTATSGVAATITGVSGQDTARFVNGYGTTSKIDQYGNYIGNGATFTSNANVSNFGVSTNITNTNTSSTTATVNAQNISLAGTNNSTAGANTTNGINFAGVTAKTNNTFNGLNFADTSYSSILNVAGTSIINGSGVLQSAGLSGSYTGSVQFNNAGDTFTGASATLSGAVQGGSFANTNNTFGVTSSGVVKLALDSTTGSTLVCQNASGNLSGCANNYETTTGTDFIQNQNASTQTGNYKISGTGNAATFNATTNIQINNTSSSNPLAINTVTTTNVTNSGAQLLIGLPGVNTNGIIVQQVASQSANTYGFALQTSNGNVITALTNNGNVIANGGNFSTYDQTVNGSNSNSVYFRSGNATGSSANSGNVNLDAGTATGTTGAVNIGVTNASAVNIGRSGTLTTVGGSLSVGGQTVFNNSGILQSVALSGAYSNALTLSNTANVFGGTSATLSGNVQGGTISNTNSTFAVTSAGVVKLALDSTTGTTQVCQNASGNLSACTNTYETTAGTDFIRNSTTQQASSNFNISGTGVATTLQAGTFDTASAATLNLGTTNANAVSIAAAGVGTTINGGATVMQGLNIQGTYTTTNGNRLYIAGTLNSSVTGSQYGIQQAVNFNPSGASLNNVFGIVNTPNISGSSLNIGNYIADIAYVSTGAGYTGTVTNAVDFQGSDASISGSNKFASFAEFTGAAMSANSGNTSGTINNYGVNLLGATAAAGSGGTLNNYGIKITQPSGSGAGTTNNYGLYINGAGGGSNNNYSIYNNSSAASYFAGNITSASTIQAGTFDTASAAALNIGTTNASSLLIGRTTTTTTIQGNTGVTLSTTAGATAVCQNASGYLSSCSSTYETTTGNDFIQNNPATAQTGNFNIVAAAGKSSTIQGASGQNIVTFKNSGGGTAATIDQYGSINGYTSTYTNSNATTNGAYTASNSITNFASSGSVSVNDLNLSLSGTNTTGANTVNGINFAGVTAKTNNTFNGLNFADNSYSNVLSVGGNSIITGAGTLTNNAFSTSTNYSNLQNVTNLTATGNVTVASLQNTGNSFNVTSAGALIASSATVSGQVQGGSFQNTNASFAVTSTGIVTFANGTADGSNAVCRNSNGQLAGCTTTFAPSTGGNYIAKNTNDSSSANYTGNLLALSNTSTGAAGVLALTNSGTNSALTITQSGNPTSGQALIVANNTATTPSGNLISLQNNGASKFSVDVSGNVSLGGNITANGTIIGLTGITSSGTIQLSGLGAGIVQANASGVLTSSSLNLGTSSYVTGTLNVANGGTGLTSFANANGVLYGNGTTLSQTAAPVSGQLLLSNGTTPTFTTLGGDATINASGTLTIANAAVTGTKIASSTITNSNLQSGSYAAITGAPNLVTTGALTSGSITSGFGTISTGNNITTTAAVQGGSVTATGALTGASLSVSGASTFTGVATFNGGIVNTGSTVLTAVNLGNQSSNPTNLTASSTVDIATTLIIPETTSGVTINLPTPTNSTASGRIVYVINTGSQPFTMQGVSITAGHAQTYVYDGNGNWTATNIDGAGSGATFVGSVDGTTRSGNGASISGNGLYLESASGTNPGVVTGTTQNFSGNKTFNNNVTVSGTLQGATIQNANSSFQVTSTGVVTQSLSATAGSTLVCYNGTQLANCSSSYQAAGNYLVQNPTSTSANTVSPTASGVVGLTVNATTGGTAAAAATFNQTQNAAGVSINNSGTGSSLLVTSTGNPGAGSALIVANNNSSTPSGSLISLQNKGASVFGVDIAGNITATGTITGLTGITSSGTIQLSGLGAGIVQANASGVLTSGNLNLGTSSYVTGTLNVANGGTGAATLAANGILYGNGTGAVQATSAAANSVLITSAGNVPSLSQTLPGAVQSNITALGTVTSGNITSFGTINTGSTITGTALNGTTSVNTGSGAGTQRIDANGNLTNIGTITQSYSNASNGSTANSLSVTNSNATATATTVNGQTINLTGTNGGTNTLNGLNLANVTTISGNTFNGVVIGTGYSSALTVGGTQIINGSGVLQSAGLSGTYSNALALTNTTNTYAGTSATLSGNVQGGTFTNTGSTFQVTSAGVVTLALNTSTTGSTLVCQNASNQLSTCASSYETTAGTDFIRNQTSAQTGNFNISGTGVANQLQAPTFDTATGVALSLGATNASAVNIGRSSITTTITGVLAVIGNQTITTNSATTGLTINQQSTGNILALQSNGTTKVTIDNSGNLTTSANVTLNGSANFAMGGSTGTFATGTGAVSLQGATSVTSNNTFTVGTGLTSLGGGLAVTAGNVDLSNSLALKKGTDFSTTGSSNDVNFGNTSLVRLTGGSQQTITGIAGGRDGQILTIVNAGGQAATLSNANTNSAAANRIATGTGADISVPSGASLTLVYDAGASLWRVTGSVAATGGYSNGVTSVGAISGSSNVNGATISGTTLYLTPADASNGGVVTNTTQTFAGNKTFNGSIVSGNTITGTTLNGTTSVNTGSGAGTQRIDANGNLTNIGTITQTYSTATNLGSATTINVTNTATSGTVSAVGQTINATGTATSGTNYIVGTYYKAPTTASNNSFTGLYFDSGYSNVLTVNSVNIINGAGVLQSAGLSGSYSNALQLTSGSNTFAGTSATLSGAVQGGTFANSTSTFAVTSAGVVKLALDTTSGTSQVCQNASGNLSTCTNTYETTTGTDFIRNQTTQQTSSNFNISGTGVATSLQAGNFDTASAATLYLGTSNANAINIGASGVINTINGTSNFQQAINLQGTYTTTANARLFIAGTLNSSSTTSQYGSQQAVNFNPTGASLTGIYGITNNPNISGSNLGITNYFAETANVSTGAGFTGTIGSAVNYNSADASISGTNKFGTFVEFRGAAISANSGNTSGTLNNYGLQLNGATAAAASGGTLNNYGAYIVQPSGSGAGTTNNYGLYIQGNGGGTSNYSIYDASAAVAYFAGNVTAGSVTTSALSSASGTALNITGNAASTFSTSAGQLTLGSGSGTLGLSAGTTTIQHTASGSTTLDLNDTGTTTLVLKNSGAGVANLNLYGGSLTTGSTGVTRIDNNGNFTANSLAAGTTGQFQIASTGAVTNTSTYNGNTFTSSALTFSAAAAATVSPASGQNLNVQAGSSNSLNLLAGTVNVGTSTATTVNIGSTGSVTNVTSTAVNIQAGATGTTIQSTTDNANAFAVVNSVDANVFSVDTTATTGLNLATNGGVESGTTNWSSFGGATVAADTTTPASGITDYKATTSGANQGAKYALSLTSGLVYNVSFSVKSSSGSPALSVFYSTNGTASAAACNAGSYDSVAIAGNYVKYTCNFTATATGTAYVVMSQTDGTARSLYLDNLSVVQQNSAGTQNVGDIRIGGAISQGLTLLTLDKSAGVPFTGSNAALAGSMYFDTISNKIQCYDGNNWGACGAAPNSIISLTPEYAGAVLHGSGIGTLTSDFCSNALAINDGSSGQPSICGTNQTYNFYKWTSPQSGAQTYSLYVTYQLPSGFKNFVSGQTSLVARTDSTNATVAYTVYKNVGGALSTCSASTQVSTGSQSNWLTVAPSTDLSSCGYAAGNSVVFKIDVTSSSSANAYVSNLNFQYANQ